MLNFLNGTVSNQIYFVYGLIGIVLVLIVLILVLDKKDRKRHYSKDLFKIKKNVEVDLPMIESIPITHPPHELEEEAQLPEIMTLPVDQVSLEEEITYVEDNPELEKTQAQLELQRLTEELKKQESEEDNIKLTHFELEQEEEAIISIQELMKKSNELYDKNEEVQYMDEGNEPINIEELQAKFQDTTSLKTVVEPIEEEVVLQDFVSEQVLESSKQTKFKNSPFISPVFGIEKPEPTPQELIELPSSHEDQIQLEQTANLDQLDEEIRKTNEFLQVLKELQKNLE